MNPYVSTATEHFESRATVWFWRVILWSAAAVAGMMAGTAYAIWRAWS